MGSGKERKGNDIVIINPPDAPPKDGDIPGDGQPSDTNQLCPASFDVAIWPNKVLRVGTPIVVRGGELFALSELVGRLSKAIIDRLEHCGGLGINYRASVVNRGNDTYARFKRQSSR